MQHPESTPSKVLVVGATGATGRHVVSQLLRRKHNVRAIARSKWRLIHALDGIKSAPGVGQHDVFRLEITEASILDLKKEELEDIVRGCDAVVCCLGHNLTLKGVYLPPRRLVTESARRLCRAMEAVADPSKGPAKFVLMGSDGVANPDGGDDRRSRADRATLSVLRHTLPPHRDNELAARFVSQLDTSKTEWAVVRPTDLRDGTASDYELFDKPQKGLFAGRKYGAATRANVAKCMADLVADEGGMWGNWRGRMPVVHDDTGGNVACR